MPGPLLRKFINIENIGKFKDCKAAGDVEFGEVTLVFGENGRGKTTLCDILRSLKSANGSLLAGRKTLGPGGEPCVNIRLDQSNVSFKNGTWSMGSPDFHIYDSKYVHENVYAGEVVDNEQKRNLLRIIVGETGVKLAQEVDSIDEKITKNNAAIKDAKLLVAELAPVGMSADEYVSLAKDNQIEEKIEAKNAELSALRRSEEIQGKGTLKTIQLPTLPLALPTILAKDLAGLTTETEQLVRTHIVDHTADAPDSWLADGVKVTKDSECPFCQQSIEGNDLVAAYKKYFGEAYEELKVEVAGLAAGVKSFSDAATLMLVRQIIETNTELLEFWAQFTSVELPALSYQEVADSLVGLGSATEACVDRKAASLLEIVTLGTEFETSSVAHEAISAKVDSYNAAIENCNEAISVKKGETATTNLVDAEAELGNLLATSARHEEAQLSICDSYTSCVNEKATLELSKKTAKKLLDDHADQLLGTFQYRINELLQWVNADFRLVNVVREYKGRKPRSTYQVLINDTEVDLGDGSTPDSEPSFKNTLSSGDRSTLALAFFLAQLELDPEIERKSVVFDDPFNSQDLSRKTWTKQRICEISERANQIIVLSHEPAFLKSVYDSLPASKFKTLQLSRIGGDSTTITPWDIVSGTSGSYIQNFEKLSKFECDGSGELRDVARTIRPMLEGYLRMKFPGEFGSSEWLGDFIDKVRQAKGGELLHGAKKILGDLENINDYSKKYHHEQNPGAESEPITDGELKQFVRRTLHLIGGF